METILGLVYYLAYSERLHGVDTYFAFLKFFLLKALLTYVLVFRAKHEIHTEVLFSLAAENFPSFPENTWS